MAVYFIRDAKLPKVKIGYSYSPDHRLKQLQGLLRRELQLLKSIPGSMKDEKALHVRFKEDHLHGEWFRLSDKLAQFIGRKRPAKAVLKPLGDIIRETVLGMVSAGYTKEQIAKALKVSTGTVYNLLNELNEK